MIVVHNALNLHSYNLNDFQEDGNNYNFLVATISSPPAYPKVCPLNFQRYGRKKQLYIDTTKRYRCKQCGHTFWETFLDMNEEHFKTDRLVQFIRDVSLKRTFTSISEEIGVDEKTVRKIFREYVHQLENEITFKTPKWLGMDEIYILNIATNIKERTVIVILKNRELGTISPFLAKLPNSD